MPRQHALIPLAPALLIGLTGLLLGSLAGCFNPTYPENLPCAEDGWCPAGQICNAASICVVDTGEPLPDAAVTDAPPPPFVVGIDIGEDQALNVDDTYQFSVVEVYSDGNRVPVDPGELVVWRSTDNAVVFLDFNGLATASSEGAATVTGRYEGLVDAAEVTVVAPAPLVSLPAARSE